ncbi:MAG TPA: hypothetical protein VJZ27_09090, partial [Aggregatilineales bacterium]|nr:hypothetical protein [Aggregatilineales bacterium]
MTESLDTLEGSVNSITYYSNETSYCVMKIDPTTLVMGVPGGMVTAVGVMPEIQPGEYVKISGNWSNHARYGKQFKVEHLTRVMPVSELGM